jgi:hypothetical protein
MTLSRRSMLLILIALMAGCTGLRIGYRNADTLLSWRAQDYFDFDPLQKQEFNTRIQRLLAWHRYEQLPEYSAFLTAAIVRTRAGLKRDDVLWFVDGFKSRYRLIVNRGIDDAVDILATLAPEQLAALQKQWDKDNRKFVKEHDLDDSLDQRKRTRLKDMLSRIKDWTGSLTYDQEQKIGALLDPLPHINHLRHLDRIRRQKEFIELLKLRANKAEFKPKLQAWLLDWEHGRSAEYEQAAAEVFDHMIDFYIAVDRLLTPGQRQIALRRLQEYADDCKALGEKPPAKAGGNTGDAAYLAAIHYATDAYLYE